MQEFIPYSFANTNSKYYDNRPVLSYNLPIIVVIGARRIGKTYKWKKYAIKKFLYKGEKFVFLRDNDEARKKLTANAGSKFFADVKREFNKDFDGKINGETITVNGAQCGNIMSASLFQNFKGNSFDDVNLIIYDEFINEKGRNKNQYQGYEFINMLYTVASTRNNVRIVLLANALDRGSEILEILGIKITGEYGFYINREKGVICHYCDNNPQFNKDRDNSVVGKIIKGTTYEENLFNNKFYGDESEFFEKKPDKLRLYVILHNQFFAVRVYIGMDGNFYVTRDYNEDAHAGVRYVNNVEDVNTRLALIPKYILDVLVNGYTKSNFKFENANVKKIFINFIKKS